MAYPFKSIEEKWQKHWLKSEQFKTNLKNIDKKYYSLTMFCYPSGDKLHVGHWYNYGPADTFTRYKKMRGFNIFQPQGFDAFGLPAENYAIKHGIHPAVSTQKNVNTMKKQLHSIGAMYDWSNEVNTSTPDYYKWTQWLFLELFKNNLAYQKEATVNWDPIDQTVLANEQVLPDGTSERSGGVVIQKALKQWFFRITDYADELLDFSNLDWPEKTILMQKHWIGKSNGAEINFKIEGKNKFLTVFTTRPDTLFGCTYMVLSPEHAIVQSLKTSNPNIESYCDAASKKNDLERSELSKEKSGVFSGLYAINPANNSKIPIWIADYVLMSYGTGAIMAVPGHDQRDFEFAKKYNISITKVVDDGSDISIEDEAFTLEGIAVNSDFLNGLSTVQAKSKMIEWLQDASIGIQTTNYRLKDWLISRQRYWGAPIPIIYSPDGKAHPIPDKHLPWLLPDDVEYKPKGTSPLGSSKELVERVEKEFGAGWRPEIDTMDTFVCSSWYYLRYPNATFEEKAFDSSLLSWLPVDCYIGGSEHATMHLLYARFVTKALRDLGHLSFSEPFLKLFHQGTITKDGAKMSKSKGNTVSPDKFIDEYGSDTFRAYLMFMGPYDEGGDWNDSGIKGISRFLNKVWDLYDLIDDNLEPDKQDLNILHKTIRGVTSDLEDMKFNTAISKLMELVNHIRNKSLNTDYYSTLIKMLSPIAPHLSEELWYKLGCNSSISNEDWPTYDSSLCVDDTVNIAIQVNGKLRGNIEVEKTISRENVLSLAKEHENTKIFLDQKEIIKEIFVPGKIINFVVK